MNKKFFLTSITLKEQSFPVEGYVNPRAKKLRLRFHRNYKSLIVTLPTRKSVTQAVEFVQSAKSWIEKNLPSTENLIVLKPGCFVPVMGQEPVLLKHISHPRLSVWEENDSLTLHCPKEDFENLLVQYLKKKLRRVLSEMIDRHCALSEVTYNRLYLRDSRSNWGCCSHKKNLSFSWRLVFMPEEVINYVVVHEVAHLREMNHSPRFWAIVQQLCPDYEIHRKWLKNKGKMVV